MVCRKTKNGFLCGPARREKTCYICGAAVRALCDFPVKRLKTKWKTCDAPLCEKHRRRGKSPDVDFCPGHYAKAKAAYTRRTERARRETAAKPAGNAETGDVSG